MTLPLKKSLQRSFSAFTLIELLLVILVISILLTLALPMVFNTLQANRLSVAGETLSNQLANAQQQSSSGSYPVEVRFYKSAKDSLDASTAFYAYQLFRLYDSPQDDPSTTAVDLITEKPLGPVITLGSGVVVADDPSLTPLSQNLTADNKKYHTASEAEYFSFRFNPDGGTTLKKDMTTCHLTLISESEIEEAGPPPNFYTIQVDPYNGKLKTFRP